MWKFWNFYEKKVTLVGCFFSFLKCNFPIISSYYYLYLIGNSNFKLRFVSTINVNLSTFSCTSRFIQFALLILRTFIVFGHLFSDYMYKEVIFCLPLIVSYNMDESSLENILFFIRISLMLSLFHTLIFNNANIYYHDWENEINQINYLATSYSS